MGSFKSHAELAGSVSVEKSKQSRNLGISICRVLGMLMIVVCHIGTAIESALLASFFQVGVQLFLFISGFLYSCKPIANSGEWLAKRFVRINIPVYIFLLVMIAISVLMALDVSAFICMLDVINMEGYQHILTFLPVAPSVAGTGHLWYLTALTLCYLATIFVKKKIDERCLIDRGYLILAISLAAVIVLGLLGVRLDYLWVYFVGYIWGVKRVSVRLGAYAGITLAMVATVALRFALKAYCDVNGDIYLYTCVIIPLAYNAMAVWLYVSIDLFAKRFAEVTGSKGRAAVRLLLHLDALSFCIYLTHYPLIDGPVSLMSLTASPLFNALVLAAAIYVSSWVLMKVSNVIIELISVRLWPKNV